ncbi:MAG: RnfABCDGE type electron transport complex subunit D [Treponema sp.]|jgi:electron transport complex protein RnfD|nr:RnfABCDGE type electron transport complex subunit D [Treponema sp.]
MAHVKIRLPRRFLSLRPQMNLSRATAARMWLVAACAALVVFQSSLTDSPASLKIALYAVAAAVISEFLCGVRWRSLFAGSFRLDLGDGLLRVSDGSAVASALVLTLLLPNQLPPITAALGACFAMVVVKFSFGGLGSNWLNPALGAWLFIRYSWPGAFESALSVFPQNAAGEVPGQAALFSDFLERQLPAFLNTTVFSLTGAELPGSYPGLLFSTAPGIIADRGLLALLLGTILICAFQVGRLWIPALFLGVFIFLVRCFGGQAFGGGDMLLALFSGGTLAAAFLLSMDPATGPKSEIGTVIVTLLSGVCAFIFRYLGLELYGALFAVALINSLVPLIRALENRGFYEKQRIAL